ncbi:MAG: hypothetical protein PHT76_16135 [Anaerostipes sp.]|nr:hypothetical protein [Anaerostipes sp.]
MAKSAGERAILKEEKREEREKKRRIEQANKMLIPVSKKTNLSLGIISFDPEGTFRLTDKRWMKVFEADGDVSNLMANIKNLSGRIRMTMHLGADSGRETCHISLMETGEIYEEVRQQMKRDEEVLRKELSLRAMSVDEVMNQISSNSFKDIRFSYASYVRGNKDWKKECFAESVEKEDSFVMNRNFGECFIALSYPFILKTDLISRLKELGCQMMVSLDLNALTSEEQSDFTRAIEKRYNVKIPENMEEDYINVSLALGIICDSDDARKIVEQTVVSLYANAGVMLAPAYHTQTKVLESMLSLGLIDAKTMRNLRVDVARGLLGGERDADAKIKIRADEGV